MRSNLSLKKCPNPMSLVFLRHHQDMMMKALMNEDLLGSEDERPRGANNREKESKTMKKIVTGDNHSGRQMGVAGITVMASNKIIR